MSEQEQLEQAIAALEAQRAILGDAVVNTALAPLREKLAALSAPPPPPTPAAQEEDPEPAVRAALAMQAELAAFKAPSPLRMRIGINTGLALLGAVGTT